jgi:hypothetical protein
MAGTDKQVYRNISERNDVKLYKETINNKLRLVAEEFATGVINRLQFYKLYDHYQSQLTFSYSTIDTNQGTLSTSDTLKIRSDSAAYIVGLSVYDNVSGLPLETAGDFAVDPALLVPMLCSYRAAAREIFQASVRGTAMENDQYLCFVTGNHTTLLVLFSVEPSTLQIETIERLHADFESANRCALQKNQIDPSALVYPFLSFINWQRKP